jgi:CHAT domain-containing protein
MLDASPSIHSTGQIRWLLMHVDAYRHLGMPSQANELLFAVKADIDRHADQGEAHALYYGRLAEAYRLAGNLDAAGGAIRKGLVIAGAAPSMAAQASLENELGHLYRARDNQAEAAAAYRASLRFARDADEPFLITTAALNLSRAMLDSGDVTDLRTTLDTARQALADSPATAIRLQHMLALGKLYQDAQRSLGHGAEWRVAAHEQLRGALRLAEYLQDDRALSYALGYLGGLYEEEQRVQESLTLTQRAIEIAHRAQADDALFQWQWQLARLQLQRDDPDAAIAAYRRAQRAIARIRPALSADYAHHAKIGQLYLEMADLLLRRTASLDEEAEIQANLVEVRNTLESLKAAEIVDYFDNDCIIQRQDRAALEQLSSTAAIVYPVMMPDRLELLVSFPDGIHQVSVPVSRNDLTQAIRTFRVRIEDAGSGDRYLPVAQQLYAWLLRPIERQLAAHNIDTLVFVPDGPLRTIPMSALHDGQRFLVENYALATTPGISLTNVGSSTIPEARVLANGLTKPVQGFSALPSVADELHGISELYPARVNQDEAFRLGSVERSLEQGDYSIVHIATHGQFRGNYRDSFLLTYDDRMTLNNLEESLNLRRYQEEAIDLLVLSACQTAAGDDRAALGMAGIAIKAGARSALATLWFINDASTSALMRDFYANLRGGHVSKGAALQQAQVAMLSDPERRHPAHWAPFLLIGNWL